MVFNNVPYRIRTVYATAAVLANANPILLEGEPSTESDTGIQKIGDGVTPYNDLAPIGGGPGGGSGDVVGPLSSVDGRAVVFSGTTGKIIRQAAAAPVLEGDSRLSDARPPLTHSHTTSAISDFATATRLQIQGGLVQGANVTISATGTGNSLQQVISVPGLSTAVRSLTAGITGASAIANLVSISQEDYDDLPSYDPATLYYIPGGVGGGGTVSSVGLSVPTGLSVSGSPVTTSGTLAITLAAGYSIPTTASQTNWNTAFAQTRQWDGGATGLVAATGRASLGLSPVASSGAYGDLTGRPDLALKADLVGGVIPTAQLPALAVTEFLGTVANQSAMLALTGQRGDWAIRSDTGTTWVLTVDGGSLLAHWQQLSYPAAPVSTVNGQTGAVVLGPGDVGAATAAQGALAATALQPGGVAGTPSSITLTNGIGLPIASGVSGLGTGIAAALAIAAGSAGAPVLFNGAGGTPSSLTLTNATGLPLAGLLPSTSAAIGVGSIEVGHASDTTISRVSAGVVAVEGVMIGRVIALGTAVMGTSAIASGASATVVTVAATGVATTDVIEWGFNGNPNSVTGYSAASTTGCLVVTAYPTAGNVNFVVSNPTSASITPGALTLNWKVTR